MYTYDKERKMRNSRQKAINSYIWLSVVAIALLIIDVWLCLDLSRQKIDLLQQVTDWGTKGNWNIILIYAIVSIIWFSLGKVLELFVYRFIYPIIGVCGLNTVFLLLVNNKAYSQCNYFFENIWKMFRNIVGSPFLFGLLIIVAIIVIILAFFRKIVDVIFGSMFFVVESILDLASFEGVAKIMAFIACCIMYQFSFSKLILWNSSWGLWGGLTVLAFIIYLLWNLHITKGVVVKEDVIIRGRRKNANIAMRILKDITSGMIISLLVYYIMSVLYTYVLEKWTHLLHLKIIDFDVQEIFFTELSLVFLVISFVTLLANKTDTVYWVDVIQYRLVKPNHSSIVDISSYIFANLILSLIAFVFPALSDLIMVSFIITIVLLGFLSIKLLISFFGVEHLKEELKKEYQMALEYRKLICEIQYEIENPYTFSFVGDKNPYETMSLGEFGSRHPMETNELQSLHDSLLRGEDVKGRKLWKKSSYRKLLYYARKFNYQVDKYEVMRDGLYSNTIKCIDEYKVNEICEQILFLLQYKEYEYAFDCMEKVIEQSPMFFLELFNDSLNEIERDKEIMSFLDRKLFELLSDKNNMHLLNNGKCKKAIKCMSNWVSGHIEGPDMEAQLEYAIKHKSSFLIAIIYKAGFLRPVHEMILEENRKMQGMRLQREEICWNGVLRHAFSKDKGIKLIVELMKQDLFECAYETMKEYKRFLDELRIEFDKAWYKPCIYIEKGIAFEMQICNLAQIYSVTEVKYNENTISKDMFISFVKLLGDCYKCLKLLYTSKYEKIPYPKKLEEYKETLALPIVKFISNNDFKIKDDLLAPFKDDVNIKNGE